MDLQMFVGVEAARQDVDAAPQRLECLELRVVHQHAKRSTCKLVHRGSTLALLGGWLTCEMRLDCTAQKIGQLVLRGDTSDGGSTSVGFTFHDPIEQTAAAE